MKIIKVLLVALLLCTISGFLSACQEGCPDFYYGDEGDYSEWLAYQKDLEKIQRHRLKRFEKNNQAKRDDASPKDAQCVHESSCWQQVLVGFQTSWEFITKTHRILQGQPRAIKHKAL